MLCKKKKKNNFQLGKAMRGFKQDYDKTRFGFRRIVPLMANSSKIMYKFNTINIKKSQQIVFET